MTQSCVDEDNPDWLGFKLLYKKTIHPGTVEALRILRQNWWGWIKKNKMRWIGIKGRYNSSGEIF